MKYQKQKAPLVDRTACKYNQEFTSKPLGDYVTNTALAKQFASRSQPFTSKTIGDVKSNYNDYFGKELTTHELQSAKQKSCAPKIVRTQTLGGTNDFLEPVSLAHSTYQKHPMHLARGDPAVPPKPNLTMAGQQASHLFTTAYNRDFVKNTATVTEGTYEDFMPPADQIPHLADPSIYHARRACFLSPGA